jgi:short-chain fatty acids transporter
LCRSERSGNSWLAAAGLGLSGWFERWFPDAFALALVAVGVVYVASVAIGNSPVQAAEWFGAGFWDLVNFTMQMAMIIVTGYAVATAPPIYRVIRRMAEIPKTGRGAVALSPCSDAVVALWSFNLIFSDCWRAK